MIANSVAIWVLTLVVALQAIFAVATLVFLVAHRVRAAERRRHRATAQSRLAPSLQEWMLLGGGVEDVVLALRQVPPALALEQVALTISPRVPPSQLNELTSALRGEAWVHHVLAAARSRHWWRRLDAGRLLTVIATSADRDVVARLLRDPHPAVQAVATACLMRIADESLSAYVLDHLSDQPLVVRLYQFSVLREAWQTTSPALRVRLLANSPSDRLEVWIQLAESIGDPSCLASVVPLYNHPEAMIRLATARALRRYFDASAVSRLVTLVADAEWRVRAQAVRSLGMLGATDTVPLLAAALADAAWWVRFRAALSLAQLGERGRKVLRDARAGEDRYARDMAALVSGLTDGAVLELVEG
ncbi:MAG: hypothetical protein NVS1B4_09320 [Gemmatimonadaceae bacterium]